jgi:hypothetical protein
MSFENWRERFDAELAQAAAARAAGFEGKARVCSRRAAGIAIGEYFSRRGLPPGSTNAVDRLIALQALPDLPPQAATLVAHLLLTVNTDHNLPIAADLIADARLLADVLSL